MSDEERSAKAQLSQIRQAVDKWADAVGVRSRADILSTIIALRLREDAMRAYTRQFIAHLWPDGDE